jgi:anti-sigma factor RsiW
VGWNEVDGMGCSPFDLKDYFFGALSNDDRRAVDRHLTECTGCREELDSLNITQAALLAVRDEEPPRRIAFVSDKVFEPRWWQVLLNSGPRLAFASAAMLSAAIVIHGYEARTQQIQPATPVIAQAPPAAPSVDPAVIENEVSKRVQANLEKVILASEARQAARIAEVSAERRKDRDDLLALGENVGILKRNVGFMVRASNDNSPGAGQ